MFLLGKKKRLKLKTLLTKAEAANHNRHEDQQRICHKGVLFPLLGLPLIPKNIYVGSPHCVS